VGAPILYLFYPLGVSVFQCVVRKILVSILPLTLFKTMTLHVPFVASSQSGFIEWGGIPVYPFVENEAVVPAANPILVRIWITNEGAEIFRATCIIFVLVFVLIQFCLFLSVILATGFFIVI
jgi:hypothetical protein